MTEPEAAPAMTAYQAEKVLNSHQRLEELARDWERYVGTPLNENITVHVTTHSGAGEQCMTIRELRELLEAVLPDAKLAIARKASKAWQDIANEQAAELTAKNRSTAAPTTVVHVVRTEGPTSEMFMAFRDGDDYEAWIAEHRTERWTHVQIAPLEYVDDGYTALAASQDDEDRAFHDAVRGRRVTSSVTVEDTEPET